MMALQKEGIKWRKLGQLSKLGQKGQRGKSSGADDLNADSYKFVFLFIFIGTRWPSRESRSYSCEHHLVIKQLDSVATPLCILGFVEIAEWHHFLGGF